MNGRAERYRRERPWAGRSTVPPAGRLASAVACGLAAILLGGCASAPPEDPLPLSLATARAWRSEGLTAIRETPHLVYRHSPWRGLAYRDTERAERHVLAVAEALEIDPPRRLLYLLVDAGWMRERSGVAKLSEAIPAPGLRAIETFGEHPGDRTGVDDARAGDGDPFAGIVLSTTPSDLHELTHCVSGLLLTRDAYLERSPLLFEGLAVAWDGRPAGRVDARLREEWGDRGPLMPSELVESFPPPDDPRAPLAYEVSGSFCRFLLSRDGRDRFKTLFETARQHDLLTRFETLYGHPLADAESEWRRAVIDSDPRDPSPSP